MGLVVHRLQNLLPEIIIACLLVFNIGFQAFKTDSSTKPDLFKQEKIDTLYQKLTSDFDDVSEITARELQDFPDEKQILIVDVRPDQERNISIIPGAISKEEFEKHSDLNKVKPIVVYCTIGYRSAKYAKELYQQGFQVMNLVGGILSWSHIQGELINKAGETSQVHIYKKKFQLVADGYQAVW